MMETFALFLAWVAKTMAKCAGVSLVLWLYKELTMGICRYSHVLASGTT
jgi:hypothetical protein